MHLLQMHPLKQNCITRSGKIKDLKIALDSGSPRN
jgi:hypothetical protein